MNVMEYRIQAGSRRCARTGRELRPGEKFYSVLFDRGTEFVRADYCIEAWQGPPESAFSFWVSKVPADDKPRKVQFDDDLLFDCFERLDGEAEARKVHFRYILALLLMRRKRLKFEEVRGEGAQEYLLLRCPRSGRLHQVLNPHLTEQELAEVQEEVQNVLGVGEK